MIWGSLTKRAAPLIVAGAMVLAAAFLGWLAVATVNGMLERAITLKAAERDAVWRGEIEIANAKVANAETAQALVALELERDTSARIAALASKNQKLEMLNAALPDGDACGLGRDRVRLLPH
ncbi:hypothetical protein A6U97_12100 [Agrobacterium tumefaciens]|uniref:hypothetical protein n=1 Tax=Agrobacterium tumefaciens TaxID=358 RepID=UPI0008101230|nr:hypothetical protein A6U97_12100 [Agrobacterium tumefaciens]